MKYKSFPIYSLIFLISALISINVLLDFSVIILKVPVPIGLTIYPLSIYFANRIIYKSNVGKTLISLILALLILGGIYTVTHYLTSESVSMTKLAAVSLSFLISHLINIILVKSFSKKYIWKIISYLLAFGLNTYIYLIIMKNGIPSFDIVLIFILLIQFSGSLLLSIFDVITNKNIR